MIEAAPSVTPEQIDAIWFTGRDWRDINWDDWERHRDAFFSFSPRAFAYYLPSIIILSALSPGRSLGATECVLGILDRSPDECFFDEFITSRFGGLTSEEYDILSEWITQLSSNSTYDEISLTRAFDTISTLKRTHMG